MNYIKVSEDFILKEFECRHCNTVKLHSKLMEKLQAFRTYLGVPLIVTSGYRCKTHNTNVGGAPNSYHMKGMAADVRVEGMDSFVLARKADEFDFGGIIIYNNFVHLDVRTEKWREGGWSSESSTTSDGSDCSEQEDLPSEKQSFIWTLIRRFLTRLGFMKNVM